MGVYRDDSQPVPLSCTQSLSHRQAFREPMWSEVPLGWEEVFVRKLFFGRKKGRHFPFGRGLWNVSLPLFFPPSFFLLGLVFFFGGWVVGKREDFGGKLTSRFGWSFFWSVQCQETHLGDLHLLAERLWKVRPTEPGRFG